jgi:hypothetical protein
MRRTKPAKSWRMEVRAARRNGHLAPPSELERRFRLPADWRPEAPEPTPQPSLEVA